MAPKTSKEVEAAFRAEFQALLDKYSAVVKAEDHWQGYAECGEDVRITVEIKSVYSGSELIQEYTEIDFGHGVWPNK